jgi:hypothetical protein
MIDYTDLVGPVAADGTCVGFKILSVKVVNIHDPEDQNPKKSERKKIQSLRVEYGLLLPTGEESTISDCIHITRKGVEKLDRLRTATGEEIKTRVFEEATLVGKSGFMTLTVAGQPERNYVARYLPTEDAEALFAEQAEQEQGGRENGADEPAE